MKPRARRIALLTVAAGCLVIGGLVALNWGVVRDHVEAWWFQATRETRTFLPVQVAYGRSVLDELLVPRSGVTGLLQFVANLSGTPVIVRSSFFPERGYPVRPGSYLSAVPQNPVILLTENCFSVLEQRFPRRAYVVVGYPTAGDLHKLHALFLGREEPQE